MGLYAQFQDRSAPSWDGLVSDCAQLIDQQVAAKSGLSGVVVKAAYSAVKGISPGYVPEATGRILPDLLNALDPIWEDGVASGDPVSYLSQHSPQAADAILAITDAKAAKTERAVVRGSYNRLRESVKKDIEAAMPQLAQTISARLN
ncbi:MAG: hypothetical protein KME07_01860 [Pegethrix bostrychoides GSE-TBD4-15B]|jgi:hypothetical protein|uniref:Uncharacterized protein n=1 Tax=Pegethrix bostrychoides GSE-TBD4-15B TaxID=2839662 RepID=A0A951P8P8_9CYAN|nr:hypothetical protein [Pegethrix bostrychoides GSE-TBD4-15B]